MVVVGVIVKVAKGGEESALLGLGLVEVHLLERLLVESSLGLVLPGVVLVLVFALVVVVLVGGVLAFDRAVGDVVVGISTSGAAN